jgi:hypothetical protein
MVVDADSVWFGSAADLPTSFWQNASALSFSDGSSAVSISWQNRRLLPSQTVVLSTVVRWGAGSQKPFLDLVSTTFPALIGASDLIEVDGTVNDPDGDSVSVVVVVDRDYSVLVVLAENLASGDALKSHFRLSDFGAAVGNHTVSFYAVDSTGMVSDEVAFRTECAWTGIRPTETPLVVPTATFTEGLNPRRGFILLDAVLFSYFWLP